MTLGSLSCAKHLGGVRSLRLIPAEGVASVDYDVAEDAFRALLVAEGGEAVEVAHDASATSYCESVTADGRVEHRLTISLLGVQIEALDRLLVTLRRGVVAIVELEEGERWLVGYSPRAAADYPLRLAEGVAESGKSRQTRCHTSLLLSSVDGWCACRYEEQM